MTDPVPTSSAARTRTIANVVLVSAGAVAAYFILRNPKGRRIAARLARAWLGASVPMYLLAETGRAWAESGHARMADG